MADPARFKDNGWFASNEELLAKIIGIENIPEDIASAIHSDNRQSKLAYNLAWAKTYLKRVNALESGGRGIWAITKVGETMTRADVRDVPSVVRRQDYDRRRIGQAIDAPTTEEAVQTESPPPGEGWKDRLLATLKAMPPDAFERLSKRVLREAGFIKVDVTGQSGDGGIGVLRVNLLSFQVLFQCKRYQGSVGAGAVRDFRGAMVGRSDKGLIITTGIFTADARREATRDGAPAIDLIEGDTLCDLLKSLKLGVSVRMVEEVTVAADWFGAV